MTRDQMIQGAMKIIQVECGCGQLIPEFIARKIAADLYDFYFAPGGPHRHIPAGEIAARFRERFEELRPVLNLDAPLVATIQQPVVRHEETGEELWNADPNCQHEIFATSGGGVKCRKCPGWFCY